MEEILGESYDEMITGEKNCNQEPFHSLKDHKQFEKRERIICTNHEKNRQRDNKNATLVSFDEEKTKYLFKLNNNLEDRSRAGHIDAAISPLLLTINSKENYFTTSSCAGRIIIVQSCEKQPKYNVDWLYVSHDIVNSIEQIMKVAESPMMKTGEEGKGFEVWFKMEPPIISVRCRDFISAQRLLELAHNLAGMKNCSIRSATSSHVMVVLVDTRRVETIFALDGEWLVEERYVNVVISTANIKLEKARQRMDRLQAVLEKALE